MSNLVPVINAADEVAAGAASAQFATLVMDDSLGVGRKLYLYSANVGTWVAQGVAATVFTADNTTDKLTAANHHLQTGTPVQLTAGTSLPTGLALATTYWAIYVNANTFQLATTRANAFAGTAINFTTNGVGTLTATTVAVATAGSGSIFVPANTQLVVDGVDGPALAVIEDSTAGKASLAPARRV